MTSLEQKENEPKLDNNFDRKLTMPANYIFTDKEFKGLMDEKLRKWLDRAESNCCSKKSVARRWSLESIMPGHKHDFDNYLQSSQEHILQSEEANYQISLDEDEDRQDNQNDQDEAEEKNQQSFNNISFNIDDIESLQDAEIDNKLLENHFINPSKGEVIKRQILMRHARNYGYFLIPKQELFSRKFQHFFKQKILYHQNLLSLQMTINKLSQEIQQLKQTIEIQDISKQTKLKDLQLELQGIVKQKTQLLHDEQNNKNILYADAQNDHQYLDIIFAENFYTYEMKRFQERQKKRKMMKQKKNQTKQRHQYLIINENRKFSLLSGGTSPDVRQNLDLFNEVKRQDQSEEQNRQSTKLQPNTASGMINMKDKNDKSNKKIINEKQLLSKFTINRTGTFYQIWNIINIIACLILTTMYPYYTVNVLPSLNDTKSISLWMIICAELISFFDMVIHFFLQDIDEKGEGKHERLNIIALRYFKGNFKFDLFIFIPWGLLFTYIDNRLRFFWVTKGFRIMTLNYYLSDQMLIPFIKMFINNFRNRALNDKELREDKNEDHIYNYEQIFIINCFKITRQFLRILFIAYYIGQYWFVFAQFYHEIQYDTSEDHVMFDELLDIFDVSHIDSFIHNYDNWSLIDASGPRRVLINTYFSMTSLSTVGFGDYHPVNDFERLIGAFVLLFGVAIFSLFMGQLLEMIQKIKSLDSEISDEDQLEKFFIVMRDNFNLGKPLKKETRENISNFMSFSWLNNRNNFLLDETDLKLFDQLHHKTQLAIFREFIFNEFLYKFRRFFYFRIELTYPKQKSMPASDYGVNKLMNPHLKKLVRNVRQIIQIQRNMRGVVKTINKRSREEVKKDVDLIRQRLKYIEDQKAIQRERKNAKGYYKNSAFQRGQPLNFPYLTFENDDKYLKFMTQIMRSLESRYFLQHEVISKELDECLEVKFVLEGKYNVGYEINKIRRFRKQFGPSTIIGAYQISFKKRCFFHMVANTAMLCYAIRRHNWIQIMQDFPEINRVMRLKTFDFYFNNIFRPLARQKMMDIKSINQRQDYSLVLTVTGDTSHELHYCMHKIFEEENEIRLQKSKKIIDYGKIYWLLNRINKKLDELCKLFFDMTQKSEIKQTLVWDKVISNIAEGKVANPVKFIERIHQKLFTPSIQSYDLDKKLNYQKQIRFRQYVNQLYRNIHGNNYLWDIKEYVQKREKKLEMNEVLKKQMIKKINSLYDKKQLQNIHIHRRSTMGMISNFELDSYEDMNQGCSHDHNSHEEHDESNGHDHDHHEQESHQHQHSILKKKTTRFINQDTEEQRQKSQISKQRLQFSRQKTHKVTKSNNNRKFQIFDDTKFSDYKAGNQRQLSDSYKFEEYKEDLRQKSLSHEVTHDAALPTIEPGNNGQETQRTRFNDDRLIAVDPMIQVDSPYKKGNKRQQQVLREHTPDSDITAKTDNMQPNMNQQRQNIFNSSNNIVPQKKIATSRIHQIENKFFHSESNSEVNEIQFNPNQLGVHLQESQQEIQQQSRNYNKKDKSNSIRRKRQFERIVPEIQDNQNNQIQSQKPLQRASSINKIGTPQNNFNTHIIEKNTANENIFYINKKSDEDNQLVDNDVSIEGMHGQESSIVLDPLIKKKKFE